MTYLHELQDNAKNPASGSMLMPNCGELPLRTCRMCDNYREGGICSAVSRGTTSALEPADDKRCFVPRGAAPKAQPAINDTPAARRAAERRRETKAEAPAPKSVSKEADAPKEKKADGRHKPIPTHKVCVTCGRDLPLDAFPASASKYSRDGHRNQCIECRDAFYERRRIHRTPEEKKAKRAESDRKYYEKVKAKRAESEATNCAGGVRVCQRCGRSLPLEEFPVNKRGTRFHACRECMREARSKGGRTGGSGRPKKPRLTCAQPIAQATSQEQVEQAQTSIARAHDNALALGLDKVARCLAEAAEAMAELANIMNK